MLYFNKSAMKHNLQIIIGFLAILFVEQNSFAQQNATVPILTADSLPTGNYKDILAGFYNIYLNDLTGPNKEVKFTSNLLAIMLRYDTNIIIDTNYIKYTWAKRINFDIDTKLDNYNNLDGFSLGLKYAIIDKRDVSISEEFIPVAVTKLNDFYDFHRNVVSKISKLSDLNIKGKIINQANKFFNIHDSLAFEYLDPSLQKIILECSKEKGGFNFTSIENYQKLSIGKLADERYQEVVKSFQNKPLLVSNLNVTTYTNKFQMSNIDFSLEYLKGTLNPNASSNLELDIKGSIGFANDTSNTGKDLGRSLANGELGLNWAMKGLGDHSNIEFKISVSENYIMSGIYNSEKKQLFTMNGTFRFRITNDLWIPVELRYDPKSGNIFGLINVSSNFNFFNK
jgi:hypothetical protein